MIFDNLSLPVRFPFVTEEAARKRITQLISAPSAAAAQHPEPTISLNQFEGPQADRSWAVRVELFVPRFSSPMGKKLAIKCIPGSRRKVRLLLVAIENAEVAVRQGSPWYHSHRYAIRNGARTVQDVIGHWPHKKSFRNTNMRKSYDSSFLSYDFEEILCVIQSELTGTDPFDDEYWTESANETP